MLARGKGETDGVVVVVDVQGCFMAAQGLKWHVRPGAREPDESCASFDTGCEFRRADVEARRYRWELDVSENSPPQWKFGDI